LNTAPNTWFRRWPLAGLAVLCLFHVVANLWWLHADNHVIRGDEESHMEYARAYYEVFSLNEYSSVVQRIVALGNIRPKTMSHPPLLHMLGGAQLSVFGYSVDVVSFTNTYLFVLAIIGVYLLARRITHRRDALFVAAVFSATPIVFTASRFFMTDFVAMTLTIWACYALLQSMGFRHTGWVLLFAMLNGLGLLSRSVNPLYLLGPAVLVFGYGLWQCRPSPERRPDFDGLRTLGIHVVLTLVVTIGIAAPWYFRHAESIYDFWVGYRGNVTGTPLAGLDDARVPEVPAEPTPIPPLAQPKQPATVAMYWPPAPIEPNIVQRVVNRFLYPPNPWVDYPAHVINNGLFLPFAILAVLGAALAWLSPRFRRFDLVLYLVWILGSFVLLQMTLRWSTPRYALQFIPALSIFAALAVLALPRRVRRPAVIAMTLLCMVQYANMTFGSFGPLQRIALPVVLTADVQDKYHDPGLNILKDMVSASNAYRRMGTPEEYNYKDEVFGALIRAETTGPPRSGEYADFARLRMLGMDWDQQHYWPAPNPYLLPGQDPNVLPRRKLRSVVLQSEPEQLKPYVNSVDYIVYRAFSAQQEADWAAYFAQYNFAPIHRYAEPAIGADPPAWYGVLQKDAGEALDLTTADSVSALDVYDLHALMNTPAFANVKEDVKAVAQQRYAELVGKFQAFELTSQVSILNAGVVPLGGGLFRMRYLLKMTQDIERDVGIYLIGRVEEKNYHLLPPEAQGKRNYFDWHTQPTPPTSQWKKGQVLLITQDFQPNPVPHALMMGFETFDQDLVGRGVELGIIDFGSVK
jgi:4-amino-4-deoxy-L-arabinose transferase-like glycosyltransferase